MDKDSQFRSFDIVRYHQLFWYIAGMRPANPKWSRFSQNFHKFYTVLFHLLISLYYPGSLVAAWFELETPGLILENLAINFTLIMGTIKLIFVCVNRKGFELCRQISDKMDEKAKADPEEFAILMVLKRKVYFLMAPYIFLYSSVCVTTFLSLFLNDERRLIYPAYFPCDWKTNNLAYGIVISYQWVGCVLEAYTNMVNDTFPALVMCLLTRHMKVLSLRVSKIGTDSNKSRDENHNDLKMAIKGHRELLE